MYENIHIHTHTCTHYTHTYTHVHTRTHTTHTHTHKHTHVHTPRSLSIYLSIYHTRISSINQSYTEQLHPAPAGPRPALPSIRVQPQGGARRQGAKAFDLGAHGQSLELRPTLNGWSI